MSKRRIFYSLLVGMLLFAAFTGCGAESVNPDREGVLGYDDAVKELDAFTKTIRT